MKKEITTQTPSSADTGRSMIEMLGTLAIMGVLSIGGIAGYRYAMDKYRANETMEELNKRAVVYATQVLNNAPLSGEILNNGEFGNKTALGYDVEANNSYYPNEFEVTLKNYPSEVCRDILKNYTIPYQIIVGNKVYDPMSDNYSICGDAGETAPETLFVYTADLNQEKEDILDHPGIGDEEYTGMRCTPGVEFASSASCYPCDSSGDYYITTQYEYDSCRACGRQVIDRYCVPSCMAGQVYHIGQKKCVTPECITNADCGLNSGKYCKLDGTQNNNSCTEAPTYGTCESTGNPIAVEVKTAAGSVVGKYVKGAKMNWWSAQNYCAALGKNSRMATVADFGCGYDYVGNHKTGFCNADASTTNNSSKWSANLKAFQTAFGKSSSHWTSDSYSACNAYYVCLYNGNVDDYNRSHNYWATCRVGD